MEFHQPASPIAGGLYEHECQSPRSGLWTLRGGATTRFDDSPRLVASPRARSKKVDHMHSLRVRLPPSLASSVNTNLKYSTDFREDLRAGQMMQSDALKRLWIWARPTPGNGTNCLSSEDGQHPSLSSPIKMSSSIEPSNPHQCSEYGNNASEENNLNWTLSQLRDAEHDSFSSSSMAAKRMLEASAERVIRPISIIPSDCLGEWATAREEPEVFETNESMVTDTAAQEPGVTEVGPAFNLNDCARSIPVTVQLQLEIIMNLEGSEQVKERPIMAESDSEEPPSPSAFVNPALPLMQINSNRSFVSASHSLTFSLQEDEDPDEKTEAAAVAPRRGRAYEVKSIVTASQIRSYSAPLVKSELASKRASITMVPRRGTAAANEIQSEDCTPASVAEEFPIACPINVLTSTATGVETPFGYKTLTDELSQPPPPPPRPFKALRSRLLQCRAPERGSEVDDMGSPPYKRKSPRSFMRAYNRRLFPSSSPPSRRECVTPCNDWQPPSQLSSLSTPLWPMLNDQLPSQDHKRPEETIAVWKNLLTLEPPLILSPAVVTSNTSPANRPDFLGLREPQHCSEFNGFLNF